MKKIILLLIIFACMSAVSGQNILSTNDKYYDAEWLRVTDLEKKSLPQSALKVVDSILLKAINEKDSPQLIKAIIHQGKYHLSVDNQNDTIIFKNLTEMLNKSNDFVKKSVINSMLGELYLQYYQRDQWVINQRTELSDFVPSDMKQWTRNIFYNKVIEHLSASISQKDLLLGADVESYSVVVDLGKDSRKFYPSMYDFLLLRAIEQFSQFNTREDLSKILAKKGIHRESLFSSAEEYVKIDFNPEVTDYNLWILETYKKLFQTLLEREMSESVLLTQLSLLDYLSVLQSNYTENSKSVLDKLLNKWQGDPISVEVIDKLASLLQNDIYKLTENDSIKKAEKTENLYLLLTNSITEYPEYNRISILENRVGQMTNPYFNITGKKTFPLKGDKVLTLSYKNIKSLNAKLYLISSPVDVQMAQVGVNYDLKEKRTFIKSIPIELFESPEYADNKISFKVDVDVPGTYMLEFDSNPKLEGDNIVADYYFAVSDLAMFSRLTSKDKYEIFVVNRVTGEPVEKAKVNIYKLPGNWRNSSLILEETLTTNKEGLVVYNKNIPNNDLYYNVEVAKDRGSLLSKMPYSYFNSSDNLMLNHEQVTVFTDRSIYRPGQTVYYKAVITQAKENENIIQTNKKVDFILRDANNREVAKQTLVSNDFGSVAGEFILPQGTLPGYFTIETTNGGENFRVEEYKRPTFEITFEKIEGAYRFGEEVKLNGKVESFSGIKLQGQLLEWRVTRQHNWWWRYSEPPEHFAEGSLFTDDNGEFALTFIPERREDFSTPQSIYTYVVEATVTDINGETQVANYSVTVGDVSMILETDMPKLYEKNSNEKIVITSKNLDGTEIEVEGTYQIYLLNENDSIDRQVAQGEFMSGEQQEIKKLISRFKSGKYQLKLTSKDDRGNLIDAQNDFIIYSYNDKKPPIKTNDWFIIKRSTFSSDNDAEVILGVSEKVNVLYELWQENSLLERRWVELNNENRLFSVPFKKDYKEGVTLMFTYLKDEVFYTQRAEVRSKKEDTHLKVKLDVFRDKILPGSEEEWRISITDAMDKPAAAEVLASMYDFSLDNIYPAHPWNLLLYDFGNYNSMRPLSIDQSFFNENASAYFNVPMKPVVPFEFDRFNWFGFSFFNGQMIYGTRMRGLDMSDEIVVVGFAKSKEVEMESEESLKVLPPANEDDDTRDASPLEPPQIRRNFSETAFFYPNLRTNEKGETQITFTVPESNTKWRFRVLAHDKNLNIATAEAFAISQKELMVTPNVPRFLRQGDITSIATKITNLSDTVLHGIVSLEFFNPLTNELLDEIIVSNSEQLFMLEQGASAQSEWSFEVPSGFDVIGVRIVASSESFSDGEQHALAVLPNRMLVTESLRMDVNSDESKTFTMDKVSSSISDTRENYRLTLEFTSNPAWYAIQALPLLGQPTSDNAISWFATYYANSLGAHIGKSYPGVSEIVDNWSKMGGSEKLLLSNLESNEELKNVLIEETPWVMESKNETEQKQKLSLLFNLNRSRGLTQTALFRLQELQTSEGGWSWFKGFNSSVSITHYILYGFSQLKEMDAGLYSDETVSMQLNAINYIDAEAVRRFESMKKQNKEWRNIKSISTTDLEYLFVRSLYDYPFDKEVQELYHFYITLLSENWTAYALYERSLIVSLMQKENRKDIVQSIINSYREHSVISEEMGIYWPNNRAHVFMSQSAISVHTFIMDAFLKSGASVAEIDNMKKWLLKQKQTQMWESTHATVDAVYALLSSGSNWLDTSSETEISVGNILVKPENRELATGYIKESWSSSEISSDMGNVTISHKGKSPAWGALYLQYFEDIDKIEKRSGSLNIEKNMFKEEVTPKGKQLITITEERPIRVGDKVVIRLTVKSDRDMEFIHIKDSRAAAFEPVDHMSGLKWQNGVMYYQTSKDASTNLYFENLPKGTYVFEYSVYITRQGSYSTGIATIQSMYAPEFSSHTKGGKIKVLD